MPSLRKSSYDWSPLIFFEKFKSSSIKIIGIFWREILSASLTDKILQDKGIEATNKLAESPNSKVVIIGSGESGMPIILGNQ